MTAPLSPAAFDTLASLLKTKSGLMIGMDKLYLLETRLAGIVKREKLPDLNGLAERLRRPGNDALARDVVEAMTTNESFFFRDDKPFLHFRTQALPRLVAARPPGSPLRVWSAASSSGQEAYSLAMIVAESTALLGGRKVEIVGTDIARDQLARAREGLYSQFEVQRGLPVQMLMRYFRKDDSNWRIADTIRGMVQFREYNLLTDLRPLGRFDIVFCRNVLIYFDQPTKARVLEAIAGLMPPDGLLYLGGAETVLGITSRFAPMPNERGVYGVWRTAPRRRPAADAPYTQSAADPHRPAGRARPPRRGEARPTWWRGPPAWRCGTQSAAHLSLIGRQTHGVARHQGRTRSHRLQEVRQLGDRGLLVGLVQRPKFRRQPVHRRLIDLPFGEALVRLSGVAVQVAHHLGDRQRIAGVDLRLIFLRPPRPHGALDAGLAAQHGQRLIEQLAARQLAQPGGAGLGDRHPQGHAVFLERDVDQFQLVAGDLLDRDPLHLADAMRRIDDVIALHEDLRLGDRPRRQVRPVMRRPDIGTRFGRCRRAFAHRLFSHLVRNFFHCLLLTHHFVCRLTHLRRPLWAGGYRHSGVPLAGTAFRRARNSPRGHRQSALDQRHLARCFDVR